MEPHDGGMRISSGLTRRDVLGLAALVGVATMMLRQLRS